MPWQFEDEIQPEAQQPKNGWVFEDELQPKKEDPLKSFIRTASQAPLGYASASAPALGSQAISLATQGAAINAGYEDEEMQEARKRFPGEFHEPLTQEQRMAAAEPIAKYSPTLQNATQFAEEKLGIPLTPKTKLQHGLNLFGQATNISNAGGILGRAARGTVAAGTSEKLQDVTLPDWTEQVFGIPKGTKIPRAIADILGLGAAQATTALKVSKSPEVLGPESPIKPNEPKQIGGAQLETVPYEEWNPQRNPGQAFGSEFEAAENIQNQLKTRPQVPAPAEPTLPQEPQAPAPRVPSRFQPVEPFKAEAAPEAPKVPKNISVIVGERETEKPSALKQKVTKGAQPLGLTVKTKIETPKTSKEVVGDLFSKDIVQSPTKGGEGLKTEIASNADRDYKKVNELYDVSDQYLKTEKGEISKSDRASLKEKLKELNGIDNDIKSAPEKQLEKALEAILKVGQIQFQGVTLGKESVPALVLSNIKRSLSDKVNYDFAQAQPTGIFKPTIAILENAIQQTLSKNPEALEAYNAAKQSYAEWADTYKNDYLRPFLDKSNKDYEKLFKSSMNPDEFNQLKKALKSKNGKKYENAILREFVENQIAPFTQPGRIDYDKFNEVLRRLRGVITPQQLGKVKEIILQGSPLKQKKITQPLKTLEKEKEAHQEKLKVHALAMKEKKAKHEELARQKKLEHLESEKEENRKHQEEIQKYKKKKKEHAEEVQKLKAQHEKELADYQEKNKDFTELTEKPPEHVIRQMDTMTGLRKIEKEIMQTPNGKKFLEKLKVWKAYDILSKGKINPNDNQMSLKELLNDRNTLAMLNELMGTQWVNDMRAVVDGRLEKFLEQAAKEAAEKADKLSFEDAHNLYSALYKLGIHTLKFTPRLARKLFKLLKKMPVHKMAKFVKSLPGKFPKVKLTKEELKAYTDRLPKDFIKNAILYSEKEEEE